jgi:GxxExxY protein
VVDEVEDRSMKTELIHRGLSESILGAAMKVLNTLKPGLDEKLYERALLIELKKRGHRVEQQRRFPVYYEEEHIGTLVPDLIVDDMVIVDPKVVSAFSDTDMAQMLGYLAITKLRLALLLNFKHAELKWKRVVV